VIDSHLYYDTLVIIAGTFGNVFVCTKKQNENQYECTPVAVKVLSIGSCPSKQLGAPSASVSEASAEQEATLLQRFWNTSISVVRHFCQRTKLMAIEVPFFRNVPFHVHVSNDLYLMHA
jgi:hypothetical protein